MGIVLNNHGIYIKATAGVSFPVRKHWWFIVLLFICAVFIHSFTVIWPLSYLSSLFHVVLKQALYCVCSAEQPALKPLCVCVFVPASLSDCVNPSEALAVSSLPCPFFLSSGIHWFMLPSQAADMPSYLPVRECWPPCVPITW